MKFLLLLWVDAADQPFSVGQPLDRLDSTDCILQKLGLTPGSQCGEEDWAVLGLDYDWVFGRL